MNAGTRRLTLDEAKRRVLDAFEGMKEEALDLLQNMIRIPRPESAGRREGDRQLQCRLHAAPRAERGPDRAFPEPDLERWQAERNRRGRENAAVQLPSRYRSPRKSRRVGAFRMLGAEVHDGMVWGIGAKNMKSGMAAAMFIPRLLKAAGVELEGDLLLSQTADEMLGGFKGLKEVIDRKLLRADFGIYTETGMPTRIEIGHRGRVDVMITTKGRSGHTSEPAAKKKINAVLKIAKVARSRLGHEVHQLEPPSPARGGADTERQPHRGRLFGDHGSGQVRDPLRRPDSAAANPAVCRR